MSRLDYYLRKELHSEQAAAAIDKINAIPDMDWSFTVDLWLNDEQANKMRAAYLSLFKELHPDAKGVLVTQPEVLERTHVTGTVHYNTLPSGMVVVHRGFSRACAELHRPDLDVYSTGHFPPPKGKPSIGFGGLVNITRVPGHKENYVLQTNPVELGSTQGPSKEDLKIQVVIDQMLEQIVELLK